MRSGLTADLFAEDSHLRDVDEALVKSQALSATTAALARTQGDLANVNDLHSQAIAKSADEAKAHNSIQANLLRRIDTLQADNVNKNQMLARLLQRFNTALRGHDAANLALIDAFAVRQARSLDTIQRDIDALVRERDQLSADYGAFINGSVRHSPQGMIVGINLPQDSFAREALTLLSRFSDLNSN